MPSDIDKKTVSCIILAGGRGRRFNHEDKGLVKLNDKTLIGHVLERIKPQVDDIVISANRNIETYKTYISKVISDNIDNNTADFQGPLSGIASCIDECKHEWILVIPCDIPALPDHLVENLIERLKTSNHSKLIVVEANRQQQLVFLMHNSLKTRLDDYLEQGHQRVMSWITLQKPGVVTFEDRAGDFLNINTLEELNSIRENSGQ